MRRSLVFCILAIVVLATESSAAQSGQAGAAKTPPRARTAPVKPGPAKTVNVAKKASTAARSAPSPVQQKLRRNPGLATRIAGRLPAGTDVITAASGFRTLGQFVSAVNGSNTAHVPFAELKRRMQSAWDLPAMKSGGRVPASDLRLTPQDGAHVSGHGAHMNTE